MTALPPAVLQDKPHPKMSARYVHVSTKEVCDLMLREGFTIASATGARVRKGKKAAQADGAAEPMPLTEMNAFGRHLIDFRHPDVPMIGDAQPRFLFGNSHDGSTRAWAMAGVFRFVCSNGMVVGSTYARERFRHSGAAATDLINRMRELAKNTAPMFREIESWQRKQMTTPQRIEFARLAATLRWGDPYRFDPLDLLEPRRPEDAEGDLWTTFNVIQEATTKGGTVGLSRSGRQSTARPLAEITQNTKYNEQLWQLAAEFASF